MLATAGRRKFLFALLYLSEGAPIGFLWGWLATRVSEAGVPLAEWTSLAALLALPWALKFFWAPLVDVLRGPRWTFRAWIVTAQLVMGVTLLPLGWLDLSTDFGVLLWLLPIHAFAAATQDVAIDALAIAHSPAEERGKLNAWMQAGILLGRGLFSAGALMWEGDVGRPAVIAVLVGTVWVSAALVLASRERPIEGGRALARLRQFAGLAGRALRRRNTWLGLAFAAIAAAGFEFTGGVVGPYLNHLEYSGEAIGRFFVLRLVAMALGALLAGRFADALSRVKAVAIFQALFACAILALAVVAAYAKGPRPEAVYWMLLAVFFCIGLYTASSYALFMDLTDARLGATQFSAFMGATNFCESWSIKVGGTYQAGFGYPVAFALMALVSLIALPLLAGLHPVQGEVKEIAKE